VDGGV